MPEQNHEGRNVLVDKINQQLGQLTASVNIDVKNNLSTRNVLAENILAGLLNRMEGWKLINANRIRSNYPAVDLVDMENRIAVQVTSTNGAEKIKHTLEEFEKNDLDKDYDRLYVVIITTDSPTPSMRSKNIPGIFSGDTDIWNTPKLLGKLMDLPVPILEDIHSYLTEELGKVDGSRPYLYLPPDSALGVGFVGREEELLSIRSQLDQGVKPLVLSGLGGIGKTVLASRFGRLYPDGEVYFIRFQTSFTATITGLYGKITPAPIQPPSEKEQLETVMNLLGRCTEKDLLIFDNVDADSGDLSDLMRDEVYKKLRQMKPRMLLTTRFDRDRAISIGRIDSENLKEIFRTHGAELTDQQMDDLIEAVNGHTMTVDLMARTLNGKGWRKVTAEDMLRAIRENTLPSEKYRKIATDYNQSEEQAQIYQHLSIVFDVTGVPENGQNVLRCATLLPEGGMEGETFGISLPEDQQESLDELLDHGWLSMENGLLRIHPVVRLVCREELKPTDETCGEFLNALWEQFDKKDYKYTKYSQMAELFAVAVGQLDEQKEVWINHAGEIWCQLDQADNVTELYEKYLTFLEDHFPGSAPLATAYNWLGLSYSDLGDYKSAFSCADKALTIRKSILAENDPDLAKSYNNMGDAYSNLGNYSKALEYQLKALEIFQRILPSSHPDLATSYNNVGYTYNKLGDHRKALEYIQKALEINKITLHPEHPNLANSYGQVGYTYGELCNHPQALEYQLKALEILKKVLHPEHPHLATSYDNVGCTYGDMGDHRKALEYQQKALEIRKIALPPEHPDLAASYSNVGCTHGELGDHRQSLEYQQKALEIHKNALPPEHPELSISYNNVGCAYAELGRYEDALIHLRKALVIFEKHFSKNDSRTQATRDSIQVCQKKLQMQQNMAKAGFNFDNPFASLIPPKK